MSDPAAGRRWNPRRWLAAGGPLVALVAVWLAFAVAVALHTAWPDDQAPNHFGRALAALFDPPPGVAPWNFVGWTASRLILAQTAVVMVAACGMTMIIITAGIDLSVGSAIALSGVVAALTLHAGWGGCAALAAAIATGAAVGTINGAMVAGFGLMPFIVTLGMLGMARGLAKYLANDAAVDFHPTWIDLLMHPLPQARDPAWMGWLMVAPGVWIAALVAGLVWVVMERTVFGRHIFALGSNPPAARLCGLRVRSIQIGTYALAGAIFGLAGLLGASQLHQGDPTSAMGRELDIIAAVVIGGTSLAGGTGSVFGAVIGALLMGVLRAGSQNLEWSTSLQEILIGAVIIVAAGLDRLRQRRGRE